MKTTPKNLPDKKFRAGSMVATIWTNTREFNGRERLVKSVSLEKRYKDKSTGEWKSTASLGEADLPLAVFVLQKAYDYILTCEQQVQEADNTDEEDMSTLQPSGKG